MLKRIPVEDVQLGMFLHKLEGSWLSHPFWKSKFLLTDPEQLEDLKASQVAGVFIDTAKGADVKPREALPSERTPPAQYQVTQPRFGRAGPLFTSSRTQPIRGAAMAAAERPFDPLSKIPRTTAQEIGTATALARKSTKVMRRVFDQARLGKAVKLTALEPMIDEISSSIQRNPHAFTGIARLKKDNEYLYMHSLTVCALMINLARQLDLPADKVRTAGLAGLLMDVGMAHIPQEIYDKEGPLSDQEMKIVRTHTTLAHDFLLMGGDLPEEVLDVCLHHHERLDGGGYPHGLAGDDIQQFARMAAVCDVYDAMTSNRPLKKGSDPADVLARMGEAQGQYDPQIFEALVRSMGIYPIGSLVRLRSNRLAVVVAQNQDDFTLPSVRAFYSIDLAKFVPLEEINLAHCYGQDQIMLRELPANWDLGEWDKICWGLVDGSYKGK
jgi:HD-GYP domain-containing protein (c-di-GMP phosphodiesterase class II)